MSSDPKLFSSILNCTPAIPPLSDAVDVIIIVPETIAPLAGEIIETAGRGTFNVVKTKSLEVQDFLLHRATLHDNDKE